MKLQAKWPFIISRPKRRFPALLSLEGKYLRVAFPEEVKEAERRLFTDGIPYVKIGDLTYLVVKGDSSLWKKK